MNILQFLVSSCLFVFLISINLHADTTCIPPYALYANGQPVQPRQCITLNYPNDSVILSVKGACDVNDTGIAIWQEMRGNLHAITNLSDGYISSTLIYRARDAQSNEEGDIMALYTDPWRSDYIGKIGIKIIYFTHVSNKLVASHKHSSTSNIFTNIQGRKLLANKKSSTQYPIKFRKP